MESRLASALLVFLLALSAVLSGCLSQPTVEGGGFSFFLQASDNWRLSALEVEPSQPNGRGIVLLHALGGVKEDWLPAAEFLAGKGFHVVAIDFRGHGRSASPYAFESFSERDFARLPLDAQAAVDYAFSAGDVKVTLVGASIGANAALATAASDSRVKAVALLSPGLDYRGIDAVYYARSFSGRLLAFAAEGDEYSFKSGKEIASLSQSFEFIPLPGGAHGVKLAGEGVLERIAELAG